jgi:hypothetical protein
MVLGTFRGRTQARSSSTSGAHDASHDRIRVDEALSVELKGFQKPVPVFSVGGVI